MSDEHRVVVIPAVRRASPVTDSFDAEPAGKAVGPPVHDDVVVPLEEYAHARGVGF
jgi:hypothetical protein